MAFAWPWRFGRITGGSRPSPPLAPPLQGGERRAGGFRLLVAGRSDQRLGLDIACAPPPLAPPLQGGERCAGGLRLRAAFRTDRRAHSDEYFLLLENGSPFLLIILVERAFNVGCPISILHQPASFNR